MQQFNNATIIFTFAIRIFAHSQISILTSDAKVENSTVR